jgi:hypothetical protein
MFEQNLQDQESAPQDPSAVQLFKDYEIRNWKVSTQIYRVVGISIFFNLIALLTVGQTNLLTRKGCDSPLVGSVCDVIDTVYFGSKLFGADTGFIDADYEKTELAEADITYIDVGGREAPLNYPEGYFALANPGQYENITTPEDGFPVIPGMTTTPSTVNLAAQPQVTPTPNNKTVDGDLPKGITGIDEDDLAQVNGSKRSPFDPRGRGKKGSGNPGGMVKPTPEPTPNPTDPAEIAKLAEHKPNKKPGYDWSYKVLDDLADPNKKLDLSKPFTIEMNGVLDAEGKLDPNRSAFTTVEGDENMKVLAKQAITTINDMGMFYYLKKLEVDHINFTLVQDDKQIYAIIRSDGKDEKSAVRTANGLKTAITLAKLVNSADPDTVDLLKAATVTRDGKSFVINFAFPKQDAQLLIKRQLDKAAIRRAQEIEPQKKLAGGLSETPPGNSAGSR